MSEKGDLMNRTARTLAILLAVVLVSGGIYAAYNTGFDNGALAATATGDNGSTGTVIVGRPYGWHGGFGFFPLFPILFLLLILGVFRPWRWSGGNGRAWGGPGGWGPPREYMEQRLTEWHKQAHAEPSEKQT